MENSRSSPVVGTNENLENDASLRVPPVAAPVVGADALRDAALALVRAAESVTALVNALQGKLFAPSQSLTPARAQGASDPASVVEAVNAFLVAKARAGKSDRYLRTMKNSLSKFALGRSHRLLDDVTCEDVEQWLERSQWNATTRRGYLRDVRTLYNFAARRGMTVGNAPRLVELPERAASVIGIHTPDEVRKVLEGARRHDLNLCRALAVRYFTGLRSSECDRLTEDCIRLDAGVIEVTARNAKTRQRRLVEVEPNLRAWLALGGHLPLGDAGNRTRLFIKACGVAWPHNVTRHSFVSYAVARDGAKGTALRAGHSEDMLFRHYRALVTKADAESYFSILPA